jgi:ATP-dependent DNA ligase
MISKRNFTNFDEFPGEVVSSGIYEFPKLYSRDGNNRLRHWQIFVRLIKSGKDGSSKDGKDGSGKDNNSEDCDSKNCINWEILKSDQVKIKKSYFKSDSLPDEVIVQVWTETGLSEGKTTRSIPSYFDKIAFEGQKNQRNPFQQALIHARSLYLKKEEKGGTKNASGNKKTKNDMLFPMLATKDIKYINYPAFAQPKLDGVRCIAFLKKPNAKASAGSSADAIASVCMYSRQKKEFLAYPDIKKVLYDYLNDLYSMASGDAKNPMSCIDGESIYLDGEIYKHGKKLQDISGESRNENSKSDNEYHIYDCFYPSELDNTYESRKEQLDEIFNIARENKDTEFLKKIKEVPTEIVKNSKEVSDLFKKYRKNKYEGVILRNIDGEYLADRNKTGTFLRSKDLVKVKEILTDEYEIVGFKDGDNGIDKGAIIWICKTADGHEFYATPKGITNKERKKLYEDCEENFDKKYKGKLMTIEYADLSKLGVPQQAKALIIRDYE